jgi:spore coat protein U-like protein
MSPLARFFATILPFALVFPAQAAQTLVCTPSNNSVNFGAYDVLGGGVLDSTGSFTVTCTDSNGPGGAGTTLVYTAILDVVTTRQMAPPSGTDRLAYNVYTDATRTQVWGDGAGGTFTLTGTMTVRKNSSVTSASIPYYGRITPGGQDVSAASPGPPPTAYSQALAITVTCIKTSQANAAC